ncbi:MAG: hypothetical protein LBK95_13145, partial [Bifidobacteriaceae bacterium]|nr:hypothetical protein [Bifidobacteriaceae bacterium]
MTAGTANAGESTNRREAATMRVTALFVASVVVLVAAAAIWTYRRPTAADAAWLATIRTAVRPPMASEEEAFYLSYLRRHRRCRVVGAWIGVAVATITAIRTTQGVAVGVGGHSMIADPLYLGLAGVIVGALGAESYRLARPVAGPAEADLSPHENPAPTRVLAAARVAVALALGLGLAFGLAGRGWGPFLGALLGGAVAGLAEATLRGIVGRPRPVLAEPVMRADGNARTFAARVMAWLELAAALLTLGWTVTGAGAGGEIATPAAV